MSDVAAIPRYGVKEQTDAANYVDVLCEQLRLVGYAVVDPSFSDARKAEIAARFDLVAQSYFDRHGGRDALKELDEHNTIRGMLVYDDIFLELAKTPIIIALCQKLLFTAFILNQQNGIINPAYAKSYNQASYHRDL